MYHDTTRKTITRLNAGFLVLCSFIESEHSHHLVIDKINDQ